MSNEFIDTEAVKTGFIIAAVVLGVAALMVALCYYRCRQNQGITANPNIDPRLVGRLARGAGLTASSEDGGSVTSRTPLNPQAQAFRYQQASSSREAIDFTA